MAHLLSEIVAKVKSLPRIFYAGGLDIAGAEFQSKYNSTHNVQYLHQAISKTEEAISATEDGDPFLSKRRENLAVLLQLKFDVTQDLEDLNLSIMQGESAVAETSIQNPSRPVCLHTLSQSLQRRYRQWGDPDDIRRALDAEREALKCIEPRDPRRSVLIDSLVSLLLLFHDHDQRSEILEDAFTVINDGLNSTSPNGIDRASLLHKRSDCYLARAKEKGDQTDFELAIQNQQSALEAPFSSAYSRSARLNHLAEKYFARYSRFGHIGDLEKSIGLTREALDIMSPDDFRRCSTLMNLGIYLITKYSQSGVADNLDEGIVTYSRALALCSPNSLEQGEVLINLANALQLRYLRTGNPKDLQSAIARNREVLIIPSVARNKQVLANSLNNLATKLNAEYIRTGAFQNLQETILVLERSVSLNIKIGPSHATSQTLAFSYANLSNAYQTMFIHRGKQQDLKESIKFAEKALVEMSDDDPEKLAILTDYSNKLNSNWSYTRDPEDLKKAIATSEEAVARLALAKSPSIAVKQAIFKYLGVQLLNMYDENSSVNSLERAIWSFKEALRLATSGGWYRADISRRLGTCFSKKLELSLWAGDESGRIENAEQALEAFSNAWKFEGSPVFHKILAASHLVSALAFFGKWDEASSVADQAVELCPQLLISLPKRRDQESQLSQVLGLVGIACAMDLQAMKSPLHAVKVLEMGRGVIYGLTLELNTKLSRLRDTHSDLYKQYCKLQELVNSMPEPTLESSSIDRGPTIYDRSSNYQEQTVVRNHVDAVNQLHNTIEEIFAASGCSDFQRAVSADEIKTIASQGPVIIFNMTQLRSDAIILTENGVRSIKLPGLLFKDVEENAKLLLGGILKERKRMHLLTGNNEKFKELLAWLWYAAVEPVLQELHLEPHTNTNDLPQVWWIGVGVMGLFPFHAAGDYNQGMSMCTMSRAISSFAPTLKSLSVARQKPWKLCEPIIPRMLIIAMDETPGFADLSTELESSRISSAAGESTSITIMKRPSVSAVLEAFDSYDIVHCICHGVSDHTTPSNSHLVLDHDSSQRNQKPTSKLTVLDISNKRSSSRSQLAFLSACSTADNTYTSLLDESIHIASGFQLAGFSHVIGTMWKASDISCVSVAGDFYASLFKSNNRHAAGHRIVALALHEAVLKLRDKDPGNFLSWVPFIHLGA
jgi:hypothetical protein